MGSRKDPFDATFALRSDLARVVAEGAAEASMIAAAVRAEVRALMTADPNRYQVLFEGGRDRFDDRSRQVLQRVTEAGVLRLRALAQR